MINGYAEDVKLWYADDPTPLINRMNWNKESLDMLLERAEYCGNNECASNPCVNEGSCHDRTGKYICTCLDGYSGDRCENDIDECLLGTDICHTNAVCTNTDGSFTCTCNDGYNGNGVTCADIDECVMNTDNCNTNAVCTNTVGSFTCACNAGYSGDGVTCSDIDECALNTDNCDTNANCINTDGSFTCACNAGYNGDGVTCADNDECALDTDDCNTNADCTNTVGSFTCACNAGYNGDGVTCTDIDECAINTDNCDTNAVCTNTVGSFTCACNAGYSGDGVTCSDIDECALNTDNCDTNANCTNTDGSFTCACNAGYNGDGVTCADNDECALDTDDCNTNADCTNTVGSFTCACNAGYNGDGVTCTDIDECAINTDNCDTNANCTNTDGSFICPCYAGYSGDGVTCSDIDECALSTDNCDTNANCINTNGSFICSCYTGYSGDGENCLDIDDCALNTDNCDTNANCTNTDGSFICSCHAGYSGDGVTCFDIDECALGTDKCGTNAACNNTVGSFICTCIPSCSGDDVICTEPQDCYEIVSTYGGNTSGIYCIYPIVSGTSTPTRMKVWCDMDTDGGGWVVFQRRVDGSEDFYRYWADYKAGFGDLAVEHWLGNDNIYALVNNGKIYQLRLDLIDGSDWAYDLYASFVISDEAGDYTLTLGADIGEEAGDSFTYHAGYKFTTRDADNDVHGINCGVACKGGWWYKACCPANLNGLYLAGPYTADLNMGVTYMSWKGDKYSLAATEMKVRPVPFHLAEPQDCYEIVSTYGGNTSGIYCIYPIVSGTSTPTRMKVWCDMDTDGGGWVVFQRRVDGSEDFYRYWADYKAGFGDLAVEHWLGNDNIYALVNNGKIYQLRLDLIDGSDWAYDLYASFVISDEAGDYTLTLGADIGEEAGDSFTYHAGYKFTTRDADNDVHGINCGVACKGGWWYKACCPANLNGLYLAGPYTADLNMGVTYMSWKGDKYSLAATEMKVRPVP
ncbi:uncharacterized protein [Amphiura filiformis]|uniref:uncharacterized protein n=1 Tax=Amphiura filiformis TaxID=82378 RepID=UPI003B20EE01